MFCSKCGTEIPEGASVCPNCGAAASSIEATNEVTKNNKPPKKKMSKGSTRGNARVFSLLSVSTLLARRLARADQPL